MWEQKVSGWDQIEQVSSELETSVHKSPVMLDNYQRPGLDRR